MTTRVSTGSPRLDEMLGGGLLPGTLTVVYGATGIGKTHLGLSFGHHGLRAEGAPGLVFDMNVRGDSQQHRRRDPVDSIRQLVQHHPLVPPEHVGVRADDAVQD